MLDPNVLVSAWVSPHGFPRRILDAADAELFEMVVSERLLGELSDVLSRERLRRYGPIERAEAHVRRATRIGLHVEVESEPDRVVPEDPKEGPLGGAGTRLRRRLSRFGRSAPARGFSG